MITPEQRAEIRRLFYAEHWHVGTIASTLGVHHDTVQLAIERDRFVRTGSQIRPSMLDPYKAFITATLEQYPRLRAPRLFAMLRERGFAGSVLQVQRDVRTVRPVARAEAYLRLDTLAGEQAQVDWGNFGAIQIGRARRSLSCFVLVLSWSRAVYARSLSIKRWRAFCAATSRPSPPWAGWPGRCSMTISPASSSSASATTFAFTRASSSSRAIIISLPRRARWPAGRKRDAWNG